MRDKDKLMKLFNDFGIDYWDMDDKNIIRIEQGYKSNVDGYSGFFADFEFDNDGNFKQVGIWE